MSLLTNILLLGKFGLDSTTKVMKNSTPNRAAIYSATWLRVFSSLRRFSSQRLFKTAEVPPLEFPPLEFLL